MVSDAVARPQLLLVIERIHRAKRPLEEGYTVRPDSGQTVRLTRARCAAKLHEDAQANAEGKTRAHIRKRVNCGRRWASRGESSCARSRNEMSHPGSLDSDENCGRQCRNPLEKTR